MTQASAPAPIIRVFMHEFTPANPADTNMIAKEIKQVVEIYTLLMLPAEDGDNNWEKLKLKLRGKNMKPLQFICHKLEIWPEKYPRRCFKSDWAKALIDWVD